MNLIMGAVVALVFAVAALIRLLENRFIYFPPRYPEGFDSRHDALPVEDLWITTDDGVKLNAWFLPNSASASVMLWFHGNAENVGLGATQLGHFVRLGVNIMALDYRGYGKSGGFPDEAGVYRDADAAYRYLVEGRHFQPRNIFIYGHSLGGAVAVDLASRRESGGLIVESSFTSGREMARRMLVIPLLEYIPKTRFDSLAKIARVEAPVLIIHGTHDPVIPFSMGRRLYEAAREPKSFLGVVGAGHDDPYRVGGEVYVERLRNFLQGAVPPPGSGASLHNSLPQ